jgi:hypothetical protein
VGTAPGTHVFTSPIFPPTLAQALHALTVGAGSVVVPAGHVVVVVCVRCCACVQVSEPMSPAGHAAEPATFWVCVAVLGLGQALHDPDVDVICGVPQAGTAVALAQVL